MTQRQGHERLTLTYTREACEAHEACKAREACKVFEARKAC